MEPSRQPHHPTEKLERQRRTTAITLLPLQVVESTPRLAQLQDAVESSGRQAWWTFYCGQYFEVDLFDLPVDRHCPLSLQDAPRRSLSSTHIVVYKVAGKGIVGCAS